MVMSLAKIKNFAVKFLIFWRGWMTELGVPMRTVAVDKL